MTSAPGTDQLRWTYRVRTATRTTSLLAVTATALASVPIVLTLGLGIWAPTAMVHEMFGLHYVTWPMLKLSYAFGYTGFFFTLLLAYIPSILVQGLLAGWPAFDRYQAFAVALYALNGAVLVAIYLHALRSALTLHEKILLLFVAFGAPFLVRASNLGLMINYDRLEAILYLLLAYWFMLWFAGRWQVTQRRTAAMGVCAAVAVGTKLSLTPIMVPLFLLLAVPLETSRGQQRRAVVRFTGCAVAGGVGLLVLYLQFRIAYIPRLVRDAVALYTSEAVHQYTPFMRHELARWLSPASYYFGVEVLATLWALGLAALVVVAAARPCPALRVFLVAQLAAAAVLAWLLWQRSTLGTMLDVTLFLGFGVAVICAIARRLRHGHVAVTAAIVVLLFAHVAAVSLADPVRVVRRLRLNSQLAAGIDALIRDHPALPVVFYLPDMRQPLIFPSPDLYAAIRVAGMPGERRYLRKYHPRLSVVDPANGPRSGSHVLVVPEYLAELPRTPEILAEWPQMHAGVDIIARDRRFAALVAAPANGCQVFQFEEEDRGYLHNFWAYSTKVTVCVVHS